MLNSLSTVMMVVQVISALAVIGLVLIQHGKGADMGASFGAGASGSLFGATGSSSFLSKATAVSAVIFFSATLVLTYHGSNKAPSVGVMDNVNSSNSASSSASTTAKTEAPVAASANVSAPATEIPK
jgi:preprotein translocase subunit SecG